MGAAWSAASEGAGVRRCVGGERRRGHGAWRPPGLTQPPRGDAAVTCASRRCSGGAAFVAVMQPADGRQGDDTSRLDRRHGSRLRRVLLERQVRARAVVVVDVGAEQASHVSLVEHDDVVETLAANRADQTFHVRILPR